MENNMQIDTGKFEAIREAVGAKELTADSILAAAKARQYLLKQFKLTFMDLKKAVCSLRSNAASINGNASKVERLVDERSDVLDEL